MAVLLAAPGTAQLCLESVTLTAGDGAAGDLLGGSVDVEGVFALIGAVGDDDNGSDSGSAYLFNHTNGAQLLKLQPSDGAAFDRFGGAVALEGNRIVVGAQGGNGGAGAAYLFDAGTGAEVAKLSGTTLAAGDFFGSAVDLDGGVVIVGSQGESNAGTDDGTAYLFDASDGTLLHKLSASDADSFDFFGVSVAISGNRAIVGASHEDTNGDRAGVVYLFDVSTGAELSKLVPTDAAAFRFFGSSCAMDGNLAAVGSPFANAGSSGAVYLFDVTTQAQLQKLVPSDWQLGDEFGSIPSGVTLSGTRLLAGTFDHDSQGAFSGNAYLFDTTTGQELTRFQPTVGGSGEQFGRGVGLDGDTAVVGAWGTAHGTAYVLPGESSRWLDLGDALAGVAGEPEHRGCGFLAPGETIELALASAAPSAVAFLVIGAGNASFPLFGGVLVPTPDTILVAPTNASGEASVLVPLAVTIPPGTTRYSQYWIVDAAAPMGWAVSNAVQVISL